MFAGKVVFCAVIHLSIARSHFIKNVECTNTLARGEILSGDPAVGHIRQTLSKTLRACTQPGEIAWPSGYHGNFNAFCCHCWRGNGCGGGNGACTNQTFFDHFTSFHLYLLVDRYSSPRVQLKHARASVLNLYSCFSCDMTANQSLSGLRFAIGAPLFVFF